MYTSKFVKAIASRFGICTVKGKGNIDIVTLSNDRLQRIRLLSDTYQSIRNLNCNKLLVPNRKIGVIHVPKTGGTSLHHEIKTTFPHATFLDAGHTPLILAEQGELDGFDIIFGHMYLNNLDKHDKDRYKIIFFRDPVTQAASVYGHLISFKDDPVLCKRPDIVAALRYDFDTYISTSDPNAYNTKRNRYARTILGEEFKDHDIDDNIAIMINQKLKEIDFIGLFEFYSEDSKTLLNILGASQSNEETVWLIRLH